MVEVKSLETTTENWVSGSIIKAYLRSEKSLNWILSIIKGAKLSKEKLRSMLKEVESYYPNNIRLKKLKNSCEEKDFL